jgi:adenylate kinase
MTHSRHPALLLLGPTGSGKTPLGKWIESRGLHGMKCIHFDFGENLREVVARNQPDETISREDIDFLREVLASGALLEDEQFPLAERILRSFLARRRADEQTLVVLNGLPRHAGQAHAIDAILDVRAVVCLECSGDAVARRLASNVGGDRGGRSDDGLDQVRKKLEVYRRRTAPLLDHYRQRGAPIENIEVAPTMTAEEMWNRARIDVAENQRLPSTLRVSRAT